MCIGRLVIWPERDDGTGQIMVECSQRDNLDCGFAETFTEDASGRWSLDDQTILRSTLEHLRHALARGFLDETPNVVVQELLR